MRNVIDIYTSEPKDEKSKSIRFLVFVVWKISWTCYWNCWTSSDNKWWCCYDADHILKTHQLLIVAVVCNTCEILACFWILLRSLKVTNSYRVFSAYQGTGNRSSKSSFGRFFVFFSSPSVEVFLEFCSLLLRDSWAPFAWLESGGGMMVLLILAEEGAPSRAASIPKVQRVTGGCTHPRVLNWGVCHCNPFLQKWRQTEWLSRKLQHDCNLESESLNTIATKPGKTWEGSPGQK